MAELLPTKKDNADADVLAKREKRSESARIVIPPCKNPLRRAACLRDPELFLRTYFPNQYRLKFGKDHLFMIDTIVNRARTGGRQAIAAPRGRGKTELTKGLLVYIVLCGYVRFPLAVAATTELAGKLYKDFQKKLATNDLLLEDFPEVCYPIRALKGAPQKAARQHVADKLTGIVWTGDYICLPDVVGSPYGGVKMAYYGLDAAFRGSNINGDRPDFVLVDDPETRESAKSLSQIEDREAILDQDIAGLASQTENIAIVVLTTVQNRISLSYRLTDPKIKPSWNGCRFGMVQKWPSKDYWQKYVELRQDAQTHGDASGLPAVEYYLANRSAMDEGVEMLSDHFVSDGDLVHSAIQQAYNKIADTSLEAYQTEYQNDPPEKAGPQGNGLNAEIVASRISGLSRRQLPANTIALTAAIDVGKYRCHWVVTAWWAGAGGVVVDYGVAEVTGTDKTIDNEASEPMIYKALLNWRDELMSKNYVDATGTVRPIQFCFVDTGTFTNATYEFVKQSGGIFHGSKGMSPYYRKRSSTEKLLAGENLHAVKLDASGLWLYELDTSHWKKWVHERFLTPTFDEQNMLRKGSLSIYSPDGSYRHTSYAQHIAAEELVTEFKEGKGVKTYWDVRNENNHWLDATYMAAAASEVCGVKLIAQVENQVEPRHVSTDRPVIKQPQKLQHGQRFKHRPGGWLNSVRRQRG